MAMYPLNCGSLHPYWPRLRAVVFCLLVETSEGPVLVDTGFGLGDCARPTPLVRLFTALLRVSRDPEETAARQVARLGYAPAELRHVVLTHLHFDHAGGLPDFPQAEVHVHRAEHEAAMARRGLGGRFYERAHWAHGPRWVLHEPGEARWFGFEAMPVAEDLSPRMLMVPLPGHTPGHCGVALETEDGWLFHCGDAVSPFYAAADPNRPDGPEPPWLVRSMIGQHVGRLRRLAQAQGDQVRLVSGHDLPGFLAEGGRVR